MKRNTVIMTIVLLVLTACLNGCSKKNPQNVENMPKPSAPAVASPAYETNPATPMSVTPSTTTDEPANPIERWVGDYGFIPPEQNMSYEFSIYEKDGAYFTHFYIYGFQTMNELAASVKGDENSVDIIFEKYIDENFSEPYKKGDVLLTLKKGQDGLLTYWGALQPALKENDSGKPCFYKLDHTSDGDRNNKEVQILQNTVLVNELDNNEKGLFHLGMTRDDVIKILEDNDIQFDSMEGGSDDGKLSYIIDFNLFNDLITLIFSGTELLDEIWINGDNPINVTSTQAGLKLGDTFDKMVELYGDHYTVVDKGYLYRYRLGDHYFEVWFQSDIIIKWVIWKMV